jgi:hypothetical protein
MVRRSVEIHLLRHVAERKLENRDTCVYIHAAIGRNTAELVRSGLSIKKKREKEREREREREGGGWKKCRRLEIDLRPGGRSPRLRGRGCRATRFARERIMENAFSMYRRHEEEHRSGIPGCLMQTRAARRAVSLGAD